MTFSLVTECRQDTHFREQAYFATSAFIVVYITVSTSLQRFFLTTIMEFKI